jgi:hypothetical protein
MKHVWETEKHREDMLELEKLLRDTVDPYVTTASPQNYIDWLWGFVAQGRKPTHSYNYPFAVGGFYVAMEDFHIPTAYGVHARSIIIPKSVVVTCGELGHNNLYYMGGYEHTGAWVPMYSDIIGSYLVM